MSEVAGRFDVSTELSYTRRRQALAVAVTNGAAFVAAAVLGSTGRGDGGEATIVVDFENGTHEGKDIRFMLRRLCSK